MTQEPFTFAVRLTPMQKCFIEVFYGRAKVAIGKHVHDTAEEALGEIRTALKEKRLSDAIEPNEHWAQIVR